MFCRSCTTVTEPVHVPRRVEPKETAVPVEPKEHVVPFEPSTPDAFEPPQVVRPNTPEKDQETRQSSKLMKDVQTFDAMLRDEEFAKTARQLTFLCTGSEEAADQAEKDIREQAKTFASDMQKVHDGQMSYAEMRALYG